MIRDIHTVFVLGIVGLLLSACSSQTTTMEENTGFLPNYEQLQPYLSADGTQVMGWVDEEYDFSQINAVMIDPVSLSPNSVLGVSVAVDAMTAVRKELHELMLHEIAKSTPVVDAPGAGVLEYRLSMAGLHPLDQDLRRFEYTPVRFTSAPDTTGSVTGEGIVEVFVEAQFIDSATGKTVASVVRKSNRAFPFPYAPYPFPKFRLELML
jgi:hypothetical protein